jgi:flagellar basal body-associated protein FliL
MPGKVKPEQLKADLVIPWIILGVMLVMLAALLIVCLTLGEQIQQPLPEAQRVLIRTIFYIVAIITFPLTNLIRYIQLRLNQTMPFSHGTVNEAKSRYLVTIIVSMSLIESVGVFGLVMFILGDNVNTLYIFTGLSALGLFLYRPKVEEYTRIVEGLTTEKI